MIRDQPGYISDIYLGGKCPVWRHAQTACPARPGHHHPLRVSIWGWVRLYRGCIEAGRRTVAALAGCPVETSVQLATAAAGWLLTTASSAECEARAAAQCDQSGAVLYTIHRFQNWFSQSQRGPLLGPSPGWKCLLALSQARIYEDRGLLLALWSSNSHQYFYFTCRY